MIEIYLETAAALKQVDALKDIDMQGRSAGLFPAANIAIGRINWEEIGEGQHIGEAPINVRLTHKPYHSTAADSPALTQLTDALAFVNQAKEVLLNYGSDHITSLSLTGEQTRLEKELFIMELEFKGLVSG